MDLRFAPIGEREARCLGLLNSVPNSEFCPVVSLMNTFMFHGHYCLVMDLLESPLLHYTLRNVGGLNGPVDPGSHGARVPFNRPGAAPGLLGGQIELQSGLPRSKLKPHPGLLGAGRSRVGARATGGTEKCQSRYYAIEKDDTVDLGSSHGSHRASPAEAPQGTGADGVRVPLVSTAHPRAVNRVPEVPMHVIRHIALQLVSALCLLRNHRILHADIKPENVLLKAEGVTDLAGSLEDLMAGRGRGGVGVAGCSGVELKVKLCDFGNAIHTSEAHLYFDSFEIQTLAYRAPEVCV
ncbi:unnamed protein product, partial [Discosporangium mesarthrocarpum]